MSRRHQVTTVMKAIQYVGYQNEGVIVAYTMFFCNSSKEKPTQALVGGSCHKKERKRKKKSGEAA